MWNQRSRAESGRGMISRGTGMGSRLPWVLSLAAITGGGAWFLSQSEQAPIQAALPPTHVEPALPDQPEVEKPPLEVELDTDPLDVPIELPIASVSTSQVEAQVPTGPGMNLSEPPLALPGHPLAEPPTTLLGIREAYRSGDAHTALRGAEALVAKKKVGRERDAAWMLIGMLHREEERHNLASEAFARVRKSGGPLAPFATWYEAEQDLARGKPASTVSRCEKYREAWPAGVHFDACLGLIARGYAAQGKAALAEKTAKEYDEKHPKATISEHVQLTLALWEADNAPAKGIPRLKSLSTQFRAALTGRAAEAKLADLAAHGVPDAAVPSDLRSKQTRAISLRESARLSEAWDAYEELSRLSADDPTLAAWVADQGDNFGWRTRNWDFLADFYTKRYDAAPTAADAWDAHRVLGRGGRWKEAAVWAKRGQTEHAGTREWRGKEEEIARTYLLSGDGKSARDTFDAAAKRGGVSGRRAEFYAAFAAYMAHDWKDALARFTTIAERGKEHDAAAYYWRARTLDHLGRTDEANAARSEVRRIDPLSWYGVLASQTEDTREPRHDGTWPGPTLVEPEPIPVFSRPDLLNAKVAAPGWAAPRLLQANTGFANLTWQPSKAAAPVVSAESLPIRRDTVLPPESYAPGPYFDEVEAQKQLRTLADKHGAEWPILPAVHDLASVGLYDVVGPLFSGFYEQWTKEVRSGTVRAKAIARPSEGWRGFFLFTRDHHHTARFMYGLDREATDLDARRASLKLAWPLAHDRYVWAHSRENDIDPYMVVGLMRQESTYNSIAESPVGARGAMQIMPRTGNLLADVQTNLHYTASDLEDPVKSVGYGIDYMGLLMRRFDNAFPLAVASYNGGPHNVSSWLKGAGTEMPMDEFVEAIPFRETRDYVKNVTRHYATYLALYAPEEGSLQIPAHPTADDASIVDF